MFGGGGGDPFRSPFGQMHRQMRQMDNMMNAMLGDAFSMLNSFGTGMPQHPMLTDQHFNNNGMMMSPFNGFGFGPSMFGGMMNQMQNLHASSLQDPNSVVFSESTMVSYDGVGQPKVVQSSTRKAGNVSETRKTLRDGEREEVSIGHSIGDKSHIIEKKRDKQGRVRQQQKFVNLKEDEARDFNERFKSQARTNLSDAAGLFGVPSSRNRAIESGKPSRGGRDASQYFQNTDQTSPPIITIPDGDEEDDETSGRRYRSGYNDGVIYSNNGVGPTIQEIDDNEAGPSNGNPKRRKGVFGKFIG